MRWLNVILVLAMVVLPIWADTAARAKFPLNLERAQILYALNQEPPTPPTGQPGLEPSAPPGKLIPGKALLLSAIIPGAGQFYAHSPIMGALFLALEAGAWAGVAIYHNQGASKEDEYKKYADDHWTYFDNDNNSSNFSSYLDYEWWCAHTFGPDGQLTEPGQTGDEYSGSILDWQLLTWEQKTDPLSGFLPSDGFTHEVDPTDKDQQYYEMIGKYNQFGAGWPEEGDEPGDYRTLILPNPANGWQWTATNSYRENYLNQRKASNDALDMSKNLTMVVLANHLASALHAGFAVTWHNKRLAKEQSIQGQLYFQPKRINNETVNMAGLKVRF